MKTRIQTHILLFLLALMSPGIKAAVGAWPASSDAVVSDTARVFVHLSATDYPVTAAGLPRYATIIRPAGAADCVQLVYPEYVRLSAAEAAIIKANGWDVAETVVPKIDYAVARKVGQMEVSFVPIVKRDGKYYRLTSFKLEVYGPHQTSPSQALTRALTAATAAMRWADHSVLASGRWVKIAVSEEGIYSLSAKDLAAMGFNDMSRVKVYGYGGRLQSEAWTFTGPNAVPDDLKEVPLCRRSGDVIFFAEGTVRKSYITANGRWRHENQPYSTLSYYFVTEGEQPATLEQLSATAAGGADEVDEVTHLSVIDNDKAALYTGGRMLFDNPDFSTSPTATWRIETPSAVDGQTATINIGVAASSSTTVTTVKSEFNGTALSSFGVPIYGSDFVGYMTHKTFNVKDLQPVNTVKININTTNPARLDFIRLAYRRRLKASDAPFAFTPNVSRAGVIRVVAANENTRLWRIADGECQTADIVGILNGTKASFPVDNAAQRYVIADLSASYPAPKVVGEVPNQDLHGHTPVDYTIVVPSGGKLTAEAKRLAEAHTAKGRSVRVVNVGEIYNEFSSGTPDPSAIRRYMKMLYDRAEADALPSYLCLFGNCFWDNRLLTDYAKGKQAADYLPAFETDADALEATRENIRFGSLYSYVTDDLYTWLDDSEGSSQRRAKPDIAVGRFPCSTVTEARILVDKSISYLNNEETGIWKTRAFVLADDKDNLLHMNTGEKVAQTFNTTTDNSLLLRKVYWDIYPRTITATGYSYPQATALMQQEMQRGALLFNYVGHGSPDQISHAKILLKDDFDLPSAGRLPLWVMASCEISPYDTDRDDIARRGLMNAEGGAVAMVCASRSVYADYNEALNLALLKHLVDKTKGHTMAEALRLAKCDVVTNYTDVDINKLKYAFLGDPALTIAIPRRDAVIDSINHTDLSTTFGVALASGTVATFSGCVKAEDGGVDETFNGTVTLHVSDRLETFTGLNNSGSAKVMTFTDRTKTIFEGTDAVKNGRFTVRVPIPRDISYTNDAGRVQIYAVSADGQTEAAGSNTQFCLNGTDATAATDTLGPKVFVYLDSPDFVDGGITSSNPVFGAIISDESGINASGSGVGHDIELTLDGDAQSAVVLNDDFSYEFGSYTTGHIHRPLNNLAPGEHQLSLRVWDINNHLTVSTLNFYVGDVQPYFDVNVSDNPARTSTRFMVSQATVVEAGSSRVEIEVYDTFGRRVWTKTTSLPSANAAVAWDLTDQSGSRLAPGLYLYRARHTGEAQSEETETKKLIIIR